MADHYPSDSSTPIIPAEPATVVSPEQADPTEISSRASIPPPPADASRPPREIIYRQSPLRVYGLGAIRLIYRQWTQIAAHLFHEGTPQATIIERIGIPLPDRLDFSWIDETLAVGGRVRPADIPRLQAAGITCVVDVRAEHRDDEEALKHYGIELLYLPTPDTYPLAVDDLARGARWINEKRAQNRKVLVHCEHGVGRSVLLAAAALVCGGCSQQDAFQLIAARRWQASPNRRQILRLEDFVKAGGCQQ